ncbi:MAG TPA: inner membrane-spanning protein YciB [Steroidobacteraceae bacterium]|nr:inner membrane-spanning protein YciB [Steroidobacteraceae bacterium]
MQTVLELLPLIAFFVAYKLGGIYVATAVLMGGMALLLIADYARTRAIPKVHAISTVLVFLFGAATLILHNQRFIQWKPTVFFWLLSAALLASMWIGKQPLVQRLLGTALEGQVRVSDETWRRLNLLWVVFYALLGVANLLVAFNTSEATWVKFKVIGLTAATLVFTAAQVAWLLKRPPAQAPSTQA